MSFMTVCNLSNYILQRNQFIQHLLYWTIGVFCAWRQVTKSSTFSNHFFYISDCFGACDLSMQYSAILPKAWWLLFCDSWKSNSTLLEFVIGLLWRLWDVQHMQDKDRMKLELPPFLGTVIFFQLHCHQYSALQVVRRCGLLACCILMPS